eukprot:TRINITY_DN10592_c0_g1_i1.p1 TRINITY_DN10592_c0_g1~~TRINITY_DN10592_c0_g1_i1.p1  ORF type:complete len:193 (+),score=33.52 TRINITY_DN10592_c0_g1_i1:40-579(+)
MMVGRRPPLRSPRRRNGFTSAEDLDIPENLGSVVWNEQASRISMHVDGLCEALDQSKKDLAYTKWERDEANWKLRRVTAENESLRQRVADLERSLLQREVDLRQARVEVVHAENDTIRYSQRADDYYYKMLASTSAPVDVQLPDPDLSPRTPTTVHSVSSIPFRAQQSSQSLNSSSRPE